MSFLNKEDILLDCFKPVEVRKGIFSKIRTNKLKLNLFTRETLSITIDYDGYNVQYYTDDELFDKFNIDGELVLPDNINGATILFYNVEDACRILGLFDSTL